MSELSHGQHSRRMSRGALFTCECTCMSPSSKVTLADCMENKVHDQVRWSRSRVTLAAPGSQLRSCKQSRIVNKERRGMFTIERLR